MPSLPLQTAVAVAAVAVLRIKLPLPQTKKARACLWREAALMAVIGICSYISMHTTSHAGDASVDENL